MHLQQFQGEERVSNEVDGIHKLYVDVGDKSLGD